MLELFWLLHGWRGFTSSSDQHLWELWGLGITAFIVFLLGKVDAIQVIVISIISFIVTLALTRLLDAPMTRGSKQIVLNLSHHRRLRTLILGHF